MALYYYADKEDILKEDSINNYEDIFKEYNKKIPSLDEALNEMYKSINISDLKAKTLKEDILAKTAEIIRNNFKFIKQKFPIITEEEAQIICSYNCIPYDPNFTPYIILNRNLCEENRYEGITKISKYCYIFLKSLRKLDRFFINKNYLYKCIEKKVYIQSSNKKKFLYERGKIKIFWGFTSFSSFIKKSYILKEKEIKIETGTIFSLYGDVYGYDISLFNSSMSNEIILEPEQKCKVIDVIHSNKNTKFINIRLKSEDFNNNILPNILNNFDIIYKNINIPKLIKIVYHSTSGIKRLFGDEFIKTNKKYCTFIHNNKEYDLMTSIYIYSTFEHRTEIYLKGFEKLSNLNQMFYNNGYLYSCDDIYISSNVFSMSKMFMNCKSLLTLPNIDKWDISNVTDMSCLFYGCSSLKSLPDISRWNVSNVKDMNSMFYGCSSLSSLPELSMWNLSNVEDLEYLFSNCSSLSRLPNISKWNIQKVKKMKYFFFGCNNLLSLPDIGKWNLSNTKDISYMFYGCKKLKTLPDISKWDTSNIFYMNSVFQNCTSLLYLPDISQWKMKKVSTISIIFQGCSSLIFLPDISKWDTSNIQEMSSIFDGCISLSSLPDISKWDISSAYCLNYMFSNCRLLSYLPDISKWNTCNILDMSYLFEGCQSLLYIPDISIWKVPKLKKINYMFKDCLSLSYFPNITKWKHFDLIEKSDLKLNSIKCLPISE